MTSITDFRAPSSGLASIFKNVSRLPLVTHGNPVANVQHYELWVIPCRNVTINNSKHPWESRQSGHRLTVRPPETRADWSPRNPKSARRLHPQQFLPLLTCDGINRVWRSHATTNVIWTSVWQKSWHVKEVQLFLRTRWSWTASDRKPTRTGSFRADVTHIRSYLVFRQRTSCS